MEMLGRANYIALVGGGKQPKFPQNRVIVCSLDLLQMLSIVPQVVIWDDAKQKVVITLEFKTAVRRVRLSRLRIVVALRNTVHVYAFSSTPEKLSVSETADNPGGLCCLSTKLMAYPGRTPGQVQLVEITTGNVTIVPAHSSALRAIELSPDGEIMATASEMVGIDFSYLFSALSDVLGDSNTSVCYNQLCQNCRVKKRCGPCHHILSRHITLQSPASRDF